MSRVKWKGPYIDYKLLKKIESTLTGSKTPIKTISKKSTIVPKCIGIKAQVYNGKTFITTNVIEEMLNHKLGEFVNTKKQFTFKKKKQQ